MWKFCFYLLLQLPVIWGQTLDDQFYNLQNIGDQGDAIVRPCLGMNLHCIRKYFARHSDCKPTDGYVPDPFYRPSANYILSTFNLSIAHTGVYYRNMNGRVEDFYINRESDVVVLVIDFRDVKANSTLDFYRYHRVGREPAITLSTSFISYPSFTTTSIFRTRDRLNVRESENNMFLNELPTLIIDPSAGKNPDPIVPRTYAAALAGIAIAWQELALTEGQFFAGAFIQNRICNFGLSTL